MLLWIHFDCCQIFRPTTQAAIRVLEINGSISREVYTIMTASSPDIHIEPHPVHTNHHLLNFIIPKRLKIGVTYAVTLDAGAVVGALSCVGGGAPFPGLSDDTQWQFVTDHTGNHHACHRCGFLDSIYQPIICNTLGAFVFNNAHILLGQASQVPFTFFFVFSGYEGGVLNFGFEFLFVLSCFGSGKHI